MLETQPHTASKVSLRHGVGVFVILRMGVHLNSTELYANGCPLFVLLFTLHILNLVSSCLLEVFINYLVHKSVDLLSVGLCD